VANIPESANLVLIRDRKPLCRFAASPPEGAKKLIAKTNNSPLLLKLLFVHIFPIANFCLSFAYSPPSPLYFVKRGVQLMKFQI
jgi:hypothetical protein